MDSLTLFTDLSFPPYKKKLTAFAKSAQTVLRVEKSQSRTLKGVEINVIDSSNPVVPTTWVSPAVAEPTYIPLTPLTLLKCVIPAILHSPLRAGSPKAPHNVVYATLCP